MYYSIYKNFFLLLLSLVFTSYSLAQTNGGGQGSDASRLGPVIYNPYGEADPVKQAYTILDERLKVKLQPLASGSPILSSASNPINTTTTQASIKLLADLQDKNKRKQIQNVANKSDISRLQSNS